jgi:hypothetical protein
LQSGLSRPLILFISRRNNRQIFLGKHSIESGNVLGFDSRQLRKLRIYSRR